MDTSAPAEESKKRKAEDEAPAESEEPKAKKAKKGKGKAEKKKPEGPQANINKALDKEHEGTPYSELLALKPSALEGLTEKHDQMLSEFGITTIGKMADWKFFKIARAIEELSTAEQKGKRSADSKQNFNGAVDKEWENASFSDLLNAPCSALQGLAKWSDDVLASTTPKIKKIKDLANWRHFRWAEALAVLSQYERADGASR